MLQRFPIVSGTQAGRLGHARATPGCDCADCEAYRVRQARRERDRYHDDEGYRHKRLEYGAARRQDPAYRERLREYQRERRRRLREQSSSAS